jgi:hypothetical protein
MSVTTRITIHNIGNIMRNVISRNSNTVVPLGRWGISKNEKARNLTVDYSNEDHCGACNTATHEKMNTIIRNSQEYVLHTHKRDPN